ncbi:SusD/RagB family nutrient-binding outer membrane lipoprotein [Niabella beijingensis]|uniref:SusD/RagB family nutrient-binding outer membrane lipoprotein n=1 Tax=Niabella beijingensis TaxID=2872700 RepID=UPI001CC18F09|nr:SusD/RagB family nutrient-binding outer membrane lipoprotein [Niabella beijingensis]MBZ4189696.1 SusD/RagB family nutrient-binding outer membrane lipoprotein [Niabella beijingensis]
MIQNITTKIVSRLTVVALFFTATSCTKGFEELNAPYKDVTVNTASPAALFNQLSRNATNEDYTLHTGLLMPITNQQGVQNVTTPYTNYISSFWNNYYQDLADYKLIIKLISESTSPDAYTNLKSISTILMASKTLSMLDRYGSIPYSKAAEATNGATSYRPEYDDEASVYKSVLADLETSVNAIKIGAEATGQVALGNSESFLASNYTSWIKFGNALRLRYAVRLYSKETALAGTIITDILNGNKPLPDATTYADMEAMRQNNYGNYPQIVVPQNPDYGDRLWYAFREVSVSNIRLSSNVWNQLSSTNANNGSGIFDPRTYVWFMPNNAGKWVPQPQDKSVAEGSSSLYPNTGTNAPAEPNTLKDNKFSGFNFYLVRDHTALPYIIISGADVHLLKAEIYARGMGVSADFGKANQEYRAGLTASVNFWYTYVKTTTGGIWPSSKPVLAAAAISNFLAHPKVALKAGDNVGNLRKIITQAWLAALWEQPEAWAIVRRTGLTPKDAVYAPQVFNKLPYPNDEEVNNRDNWMKVTNGETPDAQATKKVYWMP